MHAHGHVWGRVWRKVDAIATFSTDRINKWATSTRDHGALSWHLEAAHEGDHRVHWLCMGPHFQLYGTDTCLFSIRTQLLLMLSFVLFEKGNWFLHLIAWSAINCLFCLCNALQTTHMSFIISSTMDAVEDWRCIDWAFLVTKIMQVCSCWWLLIQV